MASGSSIVKDHNFYKRVLNRSTRRFVEDLDTTSLLDLFIEKEFLPWAQVRDIQEQTLTTNKTREILKKVSSKDVEGYNTFKALLIKSKQKHLVKYLELKESELERELLAEKEKKHKGKRVPTGSKQNETNEGLDQSGRQKDVPPNVVGDHDQQNSYPSNDPSLEALQGQFAMTRKMGELASNVHGPDLSGQSFPQERVSNPLPRDPVVPDESRTSNVTQETTDDKDYDSIDATDRNIGEGITLYKRRESVRYIPPKDSCLFDGRLIHLHEEDIEDLERNNTVQIGQGSFGKVYRSTNISKGFGMHVVVKKTPLHEEVQDRSIRREMMASRIMHPFILPLLAVVHHPKGKSEVWFVSPLCSRGDLHDVIKNDSPALKMYIRVKILLHIALALQYIHTKVPNVREIILHKDISSKNVVLDDNFNARLIDFGLAREKDDKTTMAGGREYYSHPKKGHGAPASEAWDYFAYGVIMREMLTSLGPEGKGGTFLKNMTVDDVEQKMDGKIWKSGGLGKQLRELTVNLLQNEWDCSKFKEEVTQKLLVIWEGFNQKILPLSNNDRCHICMINPKAVENSSMTKRHPTNCQNNINTCIACEKNSFLNPITCYCGTELTPVIGSTWGALLIAGKDTDKEKIHEAMANDVKEIEKLISSKAPRIIGINKNNIRSVVSEVSKNAADGKIQKDEGKEEEKLWPKVKEHIEHFSKSTDIDTLLIYITCHGAKSPGPGDSSNNSFRLGSVRDSISFKDFQEELDRLENIEKLVIVLDRCYPQMIEFKNRKRKFCQINACSSDEETPITDDGSIFTKYFIQGLKAKSERSVCPKTCRHCKEYWRTSTNFVTYSSLFRYLCGHLIGKNPQKSSNFEDDNFAFYTDEEVRINFKDDSTSKEKTIGIEYLHDMKKLKEKLLDNFDKKVAVENVKIKRETFRKDSSVEDCDTLEKVMHAWVHRQPLTVTFKSG